MARATLSDIYAELLQEKLGSVGLSPELEEKKRKPSLEDVYVELTGQALPKPSKYLSVLRKVYEKTGIPMDIPTAFLQEATLGYLPAIPTPPEASIKRTVASELARLGGIFASTVPLQLIPGVGQVITPYRVGAGVLGTMARAGLAGAKLGAVRGLLYKPEEPGIKGRLTEALHQAIPFGVFGGLGGGVGMLAKRLAPTIPETVTKALGMGTVGAGAGVLQTLQGMQTPEDLQKMPRHMLEGFLTFALLEGGLGAAKALRTLKTVQGKKITPVQPPIDIMKPSEEQLVFPGMEKVPEQLTLPGIGILPIRKSYPEREAEKISPEQIALFKEYAIPEQLRLFETLKPVSKVISRLTKLPPKTRLALERYEEAGMPKLRLTKIPEAGVPIGYQFELPGFEELPRRKLLEEAITRRQAELPIPEQLRLFIEGMPKLRRPFYIPSAFTRVKFPEERFETKPEVRPEVKPEVAKTVSEPTVEKRKKEVKLSPTDRILQKIIGTPIEEIVTKAERKRRIPKKVVAEEKAVPTKEVITELPKEVKIEEPPKKVEVKPSPKEKPIPKETKIEDKPYVGVKPGTKEWMKIWRERPDLQEEMAALARRLEGLPESEKSLTVAIMGIRRKQKALKEGKPLKAELSIEEIKEEPLLEKNPWEFTYEEWNKYITDKLRKQEAKVVNLRAKIGKAPYSEVSKEQVDLWRRQLSKEEERLAVLSIVGGKVPRVAEVMPADIQTKYTFTEGETPPTETVEAKFVERTEPLSRFQWSDWVRQAIEQGEKIPDRVLKDFKSMIEEKAPISEKIKPLTKEKFIPAPARQPSKLKVEIQQELPGMKGLPTKQPKIPLQEWIEETSPEQLELFKEFERKPISSVTPIREEIREIPSVEKVVEEPNVIERIEIEKKLKRTKQSLTRENILREKKKRSEIFDEIEDLILQTEKDVEKYRKDYEKYVRLEEIAKNLPGHAESILKDLNSKTQRDIAILLENMGLKGMDAPLKRLAWNKKILSPEEWVKKYRDKVDRLLQEWTGDKKSKSDSVLDKILNVVEKDRADKDSSVLDKILKAELKTEHTRKLTNRIAQEWLDSHDIPKDRLEHIVRKILEGLIGKERFDLKFIDSTNPKDFPEEVRKHFPDTISKPGTKIIIKGAVLHFDSLKSLIILSYQDPYVTPNSMLKSAAHEAWHVIEQWLLTPEEVKVVRDIVRDWTTEGGSPSENAARLFEEWFIGKRINPNYTVVEAALAVNPSATIKEGLPVLKAVFSRAEYLISKEKEYLERVEKWKKLSDIFEDAYAGKLASRPLDFIAENYNNRAGVAYPSIVKLDAEVRKVDEKLSFSSIVTEKFREWNNKYFPNEPNPDLSFFRRYIGLSYWTAERYPQFKPILDAAEKYFGIGDEVLGNLLKTCETFFSKYNKNHPLYERFKELIIKADAGEFKNAKGEVVHFPPPDVVRKYLNNDPEAIKTFYNLHRATTQAWMEKLKYTAKDLLVDYENRAWLPIYIEKYLFGRKGTKFEDIRDGIAKHMNEESAAEMEKAHNAPFMKIKTWKWDAKTQQFVRDKKGNIIVEEQHIGDAIKEIRETLRSRFYFPHYRGDGRFFVRIIRKNLKTGEEDAVWRMHTDWHFSERMERHQYGKIISEAEKELIKYNEELKQKNLDKDYSYRIDKGRNESYPDVIFPFIQKKLMASFVEGTVGKLKQEGKIDKDSADLMAHTLIQTIKYDLMARSAAERRFIPRDVIKNLENEDSYIKGYKTEDPHRAYISYFRVIANSIARNGFKVRAYDALSKIPMRQQPNLYSYSDSYIRKLLMSKTPVDRLLNVGRSVAFFWYIGLNLRPAIVQITQNIVSGAPMLNRWMVDELGSKSRYATLKAEKALITASKDLINKKNLDDWETRALKELEQRGATDAQYAMQLITRMEENVGSLYAKIVRGSGFLFAAGEKFNRQTLGLATYRLAREHYLNKDYTPFEAHETALQHAKTLIYRSHYLYGALNLPSILMGTGIVPSLGRTAYVFRSFVHNYIESLLWSLRKDKEGKVHFDVLIRSLAALALLGGLSGLPFIDDIIAQAERLTGKPYRKEIEKALGSKENPLQLGIMSGIPALVGIDLSGSFKIGLPKPSIAGFIDSLFGVWGGLGNKVEDAWTAYKTRDFGRMVEALAPTVAESIIKGRREYLYGVTTPMGTPLTTETGELMKLEETEAILRTLGFRPVRLAREQRAANVSQNVRSFFDSRRKYLYGGLRKAIYTGDFNKVQEFIEAINKYNERAMRYQGGIPLVTPTSIHQALDLDVDKLKFIIGKEEEEE